MTESCKVGYTGFPNVQATAKSSGIGFAFAPLAGPVVTSVVIGAFSDSSYQVL